MNFRHFFIAISIIFCSLTSIVSAQIPLRFKGNDRAIIGIYIEEIAGGKKIADYNSRYSMIPASTLKILTCATALEQLGTEYRFATDFSLVGPDIEQGDARLVITASADPTTGSREFKSSMHVPDSVAAHLLANGISYINGGIDIDGSVLPDGGGVVEQWEIEDITESYGVGLYPFNWLDNYFETDLIIKDPGEYFTQQLMECFTMNDIELTEANEIFSTEADSIPSDTLPIYTHLSAPLSDIMQNLMYRSDNLMAEGILRALANGQSRDSAISVVRDTWQRKGLDMEFTRILDGSGLARANSISPQQLGYILSYMAKSPFAQEFTTLFPRAGKEGTVKNLLTGTRLAGKLALKSGSMSGVQCYAGYFYKGKSKQPTHSVVIMINNFYCTRYQLRKAIENYLLQTLP